MQLVKTNKECDMNGNYPEWNTLPQILGNLDLSQVTILQNMDLAENLADTASRYFQKTWPTLNP